MLHGLEIFGGVPVIHLVDAQVIMDCFDMGLCGLVERRHIGKPLSFASEVLFLHLVQFRLFLSYH